MSNIYIVKQLTGGMDLDSPLHEIKKDCTMDAQNVSMSTFKRRRGDLIPSIGTTLANISLKTFVPDQGAKSNMKAAVTRWINLEPAVSFSFFYPDMIFLGGSTMDETAVRKTVMYAVIPEKNERQSLINYVNDGIRYNVYEILIFDDETEFPLSHETACEGFTDNGRHTVILTSHDLDLTFIQLNPENIGVPIINRMNDNAYSNTEIYIDKIINAPSMALPSVTVYTARIETQHGIFSQFIRPSEPVSIPFAYPSDQYEERKGYTYEELQDGNIIVSNTQVALTLSMQSFRGGKTVHVYAIRFRSSSMAQVVDMTPVVQEIATMPFPNNGLLYIKDGEKNMGVGVPITWSELSMKLNFYNTFRAAALCVKRNVLFAGNIIDEKPARDAYFNPHVFQFTANKQALDDSLQKYEQDDLFNITSINSIRFFQVSQVCYDGDDMAKYLDENGDLYCMYNLDGLHGASGPNVTITFATGEQLDGDVFLQAADVNNLQNAAKYTESFMTPNSRFSTVAIGMSAPTHGDPFGGDSICQQSLIDNRIDMDTFTITDEEDNMSCRTLQTGGHTHKNPSFNTMYKSLQHDSVYRLGMMFIYEDNTTSEIMHMGDIRTPSMNVPRYRLCDSSMPIGSSEGNPCVYTKVVPDPDDKDKTIEAYHLNICNELTLFPLYMHIKVDNVPSKVVAIRFYYADRLSHNARNVEQTGVFTKLVPPLRELECTMPDTGTRGPIPVKSYRSGPEYTHKSYYYNTTIYSLPPLPLIATQRHFYGGIIDQVHPNDRRQVRINVPDGIDYSTNLSEEDNKWKHDTGWCNFFIGRPLQICDEYAEAPNIPAFDMPDMYMFFSPETDLQISSKVPFSPVNDRQEHLYSFITHGFLTSLVPAGQNRGMISAAYNTENDYFNHFFSLEHVKVGPPFESGMGNKQSYRLMEAHEGKYSFKDFNKLSTVKSDGVEITVRSVIDHGAWPQEYNCTYDSLYMHNNFCPTFTLINPIPKSSEYEKGYPPRKGFAGLMSTLVSQEGLEQSTGKFWDACWKLWGEKTLTKNVHLGRKIGGGASRRTLKYYINWDVYSQSFEPDKKKFMRGVKIEPTHMKQTGHVVKDPPSQHAFLFPCSYFPINGSNVDGTCFDPIKVGDFLFCNIVPLYAGKVQADNKVDLLLNDLDPYVKDNLSESQQAYRDAIVATQGYPVLAVYKAWRWLRGTDETVNMDLIKETRDLLGKKCAGGYEWYIKDTAFMTNLFSFSSPRYYNNFFHGGDRNGDTTTVQKLQNNNHAWDAGLIPFAEHGQCAIGLEAYVSLTPYFSTATVRRSDTIWYPGKGEKGHNSLASKWDNEFCDYEEEFMLFSPTQVPDYKHLIFPSVTWADWPNAFGYDSMGHCRIDSHMNEMIFKNIDGSVSWEIKDPGTPEETHPGILRTGDYFTGLNHHGYGGPGVIFAVDQCSCDLPHSYESDKFQVSSDRVQVTDKDTKETYEVGTFFTDTFLEQRAYSNLEISSTRGNHIAYKDLENEGVYYLTLDDLRNNVNSYVKGKETEPIKITIQKGYSVDTIFNSVKSMEPVGRFPFVYKKVPFKGTVYVYTKALDDGTLAGEKIDLYYDFNHTKDGDFYVVPAYNYALGDFSKHMKTGSYDTTIMPEETRHAIAVAVSGAVDAAIFAATDGVGALALTVINGVVFSVVDFSLAWASKKKHTYYMDKIFYNEVNKFMKQGFFYAYIHSLVDYEDMMIFTKPKLVLSSNNLLSQERVIISDRRAQEETEYKANSDCDYLRENMVDRPINLDYMQEAFNNGSHVILATLRKRHSVPFENVPISETQWCRATELEVNDENEAIGFVTSFDCYTGIYRRPYMNAFYPDGKMNIPEQANACSSPTVMCFPYEGLVNVEIADPIYPMTAPTEKQRYSNPRSFHDPYDFYVKTDVVTLGELLIFNPIVVSQELPAWDYQLAYSNYLWKDVGVGLGYSAQDMRRHANRVIYARFNYDDGTFGNFEIAGTKTLDLEPTFGDVHQVINYKNSIIVIQDRAVTTALPDLPVLLQDANRAKIEAGNPAGATSGVVIGSSEIFTMKGQITSLYGCSQNGQSAAYATADHIYWFDSYRECVCVFTQEGVKNLSVGTNTSGWARQVSRLVREGKGYVSLYENRDSTLRIAYHGAEKIMPEEFPFNRNAKRQVIELCEKTMTFSSFISANYDVAAKLHGGNVFFHRDRSTHFMYTLDEGTFNGFYMPVQEQGDMYVTAPVTPDPEHLSEVNFLSVFLHNTDHFVEDYVVESTIVAGGYFKGSMKWEGNVFNAKTAEQFGTYYEVGLPKQSYQDFTMSFRGNTSIIGLRFTSFSPMSNGVDNQRFEEWNLAKMKNYYINSFKLGITMEKTNI